MARSKDYEQLLEQAKDIVINSIGETMDLYGVNRSVGNLYGTMVFEQSNMTLDEMRYELQMSKPSMSAGVKRLQEFDGVKSLFEEVENNTLLLKKTFLRFLETSFHKNGNVKSN